MSAKTVITDSSNQVVAPYGGIGDSCVKTGQQSYLRINRPILYLHRINRRGRGGEEEKKDGRKKKTVQFQDQPAPRRSTRTPRKM
jgi:hypothetical protein